MKQDFTIYIFDYQNISMEKAEWFQDIDLDQAKYIIYDKDIINYRWENQEITFTRKFSDHMPAYLDDSGNFLLIFDGKRILGGRTSHESTPAGIEGAVLYMTIKSYRDGNNLTYRLRNNQSAYADPPFMFPAPSDIAEQVKAHFRALGKLTE